MERAIEEYRVGSEPYYLAVAREVELFESAHAARLPVMLKGPTGCGKTRFVEHMAWRLERPLITVACHEDLSATDLVGRFLLEGEETIWHDGPLTRAVRNGAICYLDEVVEARKDTIVIIHPLTTFGFVEGPIHIGKSAAVDREMRTFESPTGYHGHYGRSRSRSPTRRYY